MTPTTGPSQFPPVPAPTQAHGCHHPVATTRECLVAVWALAGLWIATAILTIIIRVQMSGDIDTLHGAAAQDQQKIATFQGQVSQDQNQLTQVKQTAAADAKCNQAAQGLLQWWNSTNPDESAVSKLVAQIQTDCVPATAP